MADIKGDQYGDFSLKNVLVVEPIIILFGEQM
jgi:hypothetical protein